MIVLVGFKKFIKGSSAGGPFTLNWEYSTARTIWNLSMVDLCEIARNSVLHADFTSYEKVQMIGIIPANIKDRNKKNMPNKDNVPHSRIKFRQNLYECESHLLETLAPYDDQTSSGETLTEAISRSKSEIEIEMAIEEKMKENYGYSHMY